jgi:hypothetical protein
MTKRFFASSSALLAAQLSLLAWSQASRRICSMSMVPRRKVSVE